MSRSDEPSGNRRDVRFPFTPRTAAAAGVVAFALIATGILVPGGRDGGVRLQFAIGDGDRLRTDAVPEGIVQQTVRTTRQRLRHACPGGSAAAAGPPPDRITVECRGVGPTAALVGLLSSRARLEFSVVEGEPAPGQEMLLRRHGGELPRGLAIVPAQAPDGTAPAEYYVVHRPAVVTGSDIEAARPTTDEFSKPAVALTLRRDAVAKMSAMTSANVGKLLAIVLDDRVTSAPVIQEAIATTEIRITGTFSQKDVSDLALVLRSGSLPRALHLVDERELPAEPGFRVGKIVLLGAGGLATALALLSFLGYVTDRRPVDRAIG
jgi:protein-export membrane protein SecD